MTREVIEMGNFSDTKITTFKDKQGSVRYPITIPEAVNMGSGLSLRDVAETIVDQLDNAIYWDDTTAPGGVDFTMYYYTKNEVDKLLKDIVLDGGKVYSKDEINDMFDRVFIKEEVIQLIEDAKIQNGGNKPTIDSYSKAEIDVFLEAIREEIQELRDRKVDAYTKEETNSLIKGVKNNVSETYYTKAEIDSKFEDLELPESTPEPVENIKFLNPVDIVIDL